MEMQTLSKDKVTILYMIGEPIIMGYLILYDKIRSFYLIFDMLILYIILSQ